MNEEIKTPMPQSTAAPTVSPDKKPDDAAGLLIEARFKIFDPTSGRTFVEGRA